MVIQPTIFLDIDGVMVTDQSEIILHPKFMRGSFDSGCVDILNEIVEIINPNIVISSDWKNLSIESLNEIFSDFGVNAIVNDVTIDLWGTKFKSYQQLEECRSEEILDFVNKHKLTNWIAVDDLFLLPWMPNNFVHCFNKKGIKLKGVKDKIINILKYER